MERMRRKKSSRECPVGSLLFCAYLLVNNIYTLLYIFTIIQPEGRSVALHSLFTSAASDSEDGFDGVLDGLAGLLVAVLLVEELG